VLPLWLATIGTSRARKKWTMIEMTDNALLADGFSEALIGMGNRFAYDVAVYDYAKCIEILAREMSHEDAVEYFEFNVIGAYMGEHTPVFVTVGSTP